MAELVKVDNYHNNKAASFFIYENCLISNELKKNIIWEKYLHDIFTKYITPDSIVIEGGCHIGTHTIKLGMLAKHVYAFEPMKSSYNLLEKNISINGLKNISIFKKGLANTYNTVYFDWIPEDNPGASGLSNNPMGKPFWFKDNIKKQKVELTTIDSLNLDRLDFIKLDIEGYEKLAISGAMQTIKKYKPVITLEFWADHSGNVDINFTKNNFKELLDIGYDVINIMGPDFLFLPK